MNALLKMSSAKTAIVMKMNVVMWDLRSAKAVVARATVTRNIVAAAKKTWKSAH